MSKFGVGQPVRRSEDPRLLTGRGRYTDDMAVEGALHAVFVRAPVANARIAAISIDEARAAPGVVSILTGADLEAAGIRPIRASSSVTSADGSPMAEPSRPNLATTRVAHVGEPIVMVIAETLDAARNAAELVAIDFDTLPAVVDPRTALAPDAPQIWPEAARNLAFDWELGDQNAVESAFAAADRIVSIEIVNNRIVPNPLEGRACHAVWEADQERVALTVSSQGTHSLRNKLAREIFQTPPEAIRVRTPDVGGGFGMKLFLYPEYVCVVHAARTLKRPVRWAADRSEGFVADDHGRDNFTHAQLALDSDGQILALRVDTLANMGAYLSTFAPYVVTSGAARMTPGLYRVPALHVRVRGVFTNTQPVDAYRGAGRPEAAYMVERLMDAAARETGLGAVEIRRRNFIPPEAMPHKTPSGHEYDSGEFARNMEDALRLAEWDGIEARKADAAARGKLRGIGLATYVEACGGGAPEHAHVSVDADGRVRVTVGTQSNGQGHETAYKQLIAEHLGVSPDKIVVIQGDTVAVPMGGGTSGSRSIPVGGAAIRDAALQIQDQARARAADMLEAAPADIHLENGRFVIVGTDRSVTLQEIAAKSEEDLTANASFKPSAPTFPNGAHICEVEIDPETGVVEVIRYTVVDDFGTVLNPLLLEGQVHGGIAQGLGQALIERTVFNREGQLLTGSFMDYAMPRADDLPFVAFRYNEVPCATNPLGVKGAGEAGSIGAPPAAINAIIDALTPLGVGHIDMPATPQTVWSAIRAASNNRLSA